MKTVEWDAQDVEAMTTERAKADAISGSSIVVLMPLSFCGH